MVMAGNYPFQLTNGFLVYWFNGSTWLVINCVVKILEARYVQDKLQIIVNYV